MSEFLPSATHTSELFGGWCFIQSLIEVCEWFKYRSIVLANLEFNSIYFGCGSCGVLRLSVCLC